MEDRTFIEWDKDDIDALGLMKVDVLALGMLTLHPQAASISSRALRQGLHARHRCRRTIRRSTRCSAGRFGRRVPGREPGADVDAAAAEAGMFYDLVIEVAIVRPGPIQGDMVHPYLRRRDRHRARSLSLARPSMGRPTSSRRCWSKTLGVPLFQEQAMQIAIAAAKFTPDEADGLRRAMATFRHDGTIDLFRDKFIDGMVARGYEREFRRALLQADRGLRRLRLPGEPRGQLRAPGLRLGLDQVPLPGRVLRRHPQQPADGLLPAGPARARRARARRRGARRRRQCQRLGLHAGAGARTGSAKGPLRAGRVEPAVRLGFRQSRAQEGGIAALVARARQRLLQHRPARRDRRPFAPDPGAARRSRRFPLAPARPARRLWAARRLDAIGLKSAVLNLRRHPETAATRPAKGRPEADRDLPPRPIAPPVHAASDRRALPGAGVALPEMALCEHVADDYATTGLSLKEHPVAFSAPPLRARRRRTRRFAVTSCRRTRASRSPASC